MIEDAHGTDVERMSYFPTPEASSQSEREQRGATAVVVPIGELDIDTAPRPRARPRPRHSTVPPTVWCSTFANSTSSTRAVCAVYLIARRCAENTRKHFALVAGSRELERTLEIAGVHSIFDWTPPKSWADAAIAQIASRPPPLDDSKFPTPGPAAEDAHPADEPEQRGVVGVA